MKKIAYVCLLVLLCLGIAACGNKIADEEQIQLDLEEEESFHFLNPGEEITDVVIDKRRTDKKEKRDKVWCTVTTEDSLVSCTKSVVVTYGLYGRDGWILDGVSVNDESEWIKKLIKGVEEATIPSYLAGYGIQVEEEYWGITYDNVSDVVVEKHDTDLRGMQDVVTVTVTLDDLVEQAKGQMILTFSFEDVWQLESITGDESFQVEEKPDKAVQLTDDDVIAALTGRTFEIGKPKAEGTVVFYLASDVQTVSIGADEISDISYTEQETAYRGTYKAIACNCTVTKPHVTFRLDTMLYYNYMEETGWQMTEGPIEAEAVSVNLLGEWRGTYKGSPYSGESVLQITDMDDAGNITAVYTWLSEDSDGGSYHASGTIDMSNLYIGLEPGEWIQKPSYVWLGTTHEINARLYAEEDAIKGIVQDSYPFSVTPEE